MIICVEEARAAGIEQMISLPRGKGLEIISIGFEIEAHAQPRQELHALDAARTGSARSSAPPAQRSGWPCGYGGAPVGGGSRRVLLPDDLSGRGALKQMARL